ncbi:MAG: MoxR family ATPase [Chloroflexota bacterium]
MRPKDVQALLEEILDRGNHTPIFLWGAPGVGKSSVVRQVSERQAVGFLDIRMTLLDPTDLRGIPIPKEGRAEWLAPSFLPDMKRDGERGIMFLDELNAAPPLVQASGYQLVLDRRVGEYELPKGWTIIGAGNRQGDRAVVHRMPSPLSNRFIHIEFDVSLDDWTDWAIMHNIASEVIGFIRFRPDLLFAFDPQRDERAFPTPRSWEYVSRLMGNSTTGTKPIPRNLLSEAVAGTVGGGAGAEYLAYLDVYQNLPDIAAILNGANTIPERKDLKYACITACANRCEEKHVDHLVAYSMRYPAEFAVLLIKLLMVKHRKALTASEAYRKQWMLKFREVIL